MKQLLLIYFLVMTAFAGRPPRNAKPFSIAFRNMVGERPLHLSEETYLNDWGEPFSVRQCKYYIHNLSYTDNRNNTYHAPEHYYLIDQSDSSSLFVSLPEPEGPITSVSFTVGVDSIDNVRGAQNGALDPTHGMFWTWNSGYVFAKLDGQSDSSHAPGHYFSYHVGGYRNGQNVAQVIFLRRGQYMKQPFPVFIEADILTWFKSRYSIHIAQTPVCHEPGKLALDLSDNYATMFHIVAP